MTKTGELLSRLDRAQPIVRQRDMYFRGDQPLRFLKDKLAPVMGFRSNLAEVAVTAVAERINLESVTASINFPTGPVDVSERARALVQDSDFPMLLQSLITDMLAVGSAYIMVWVDGLGRPVVTGESAEQVAVSRDPITGGVTGAVKRWQVLDSSGVLKEEHVIKYGPKQIVHLKRGDTRGKLTFVSAVDNPLGVVPVVPLINIKRLNDHTGSSVIDSLAPLLDALNKVIVDMLTTSESVARPKRYATGVVLEDDEDGFIADEGFTAESEQPESDTAGVESPFKDSDDLWISEQAEAKFGQLAGADLGGYKTAVDLIIQQIMAVTSLPGHMVGVTTSNPSTAEALRASEVALSSNAESRVRVINRPVEWAVRLLVALDYGVPPALVDVKNQWASTATRSVAQEADAAVKLVSQEVITADEARSNVGIKETL